MPRQRNGESGPPVFRTDVEECESALCVVHSSALKYVGGGDEYSCERYDLRNFISIIHQRSIACQMTSLFSSDDGSKRNAAHDSKDEVASGRG